MSQKTVLITDRVAPICLELLEEHGFEADVQLGKSPEELKELVPQARGWIVRSGTRVTADLIDVADHLEVIGRAGVGVDNIDLDAATRRGLLVINAPHGNTISTAEHSCAMLMALARRIPQAHASLKSGAWDRKAFSGSEVYEKTLGVIGIGKIGREVVTRMKGFGMKVVAHDPVVSEEVADRLGVELVALDELCERSDYITVHTPLNDNTRGLLDYSQLQKCKDGVGIVNCARGGIVDEASLLKALQDEKVSGAALDVYSQEPPPDELDDLIQHPDVIATPHIAASTEAAQSKVARQITEQVINALDGQTVNTPVNAMAIKMASKKEVQPYLRLAERLGQIASQLTEGHLNRVTVKCHGDVPHRYAEVVSIAAVKGILGRHVEGPVNLINAPVLAEEMGLRVEEQRGTTTEGFTNVIEVDLASDEEERLVAGTILGSDDPRVVRIDDFDGLEVRPEGNLLFYRNEDRPGMLAAVGSILAEENINIGSLALGRTGKGAMALTAISVDEAVPQQALTRMKEVEGVHGVRPVSLA